MHDARAVANRLIELAGDDGNELTVMQVMKLVYFCHAWMLGLHHRPLIEQPVEAWPLGPIIRDVHRSFRKYHGNPISARTRAPEAKFDHEEENLVGQVYQKYGRLSGIRLSELSHEDGTPWEQVWRRNQQTSIIPRSLMAEYYSSVAG